MLWRGYENNFGFWGVFDFLKMFFDVFYAFGCFVCFVHGMSEGVFYYFVLFCLSVVSPSFFEMGGGLVKLFVFLSFFFLFFFFFFHFWEGLKSFYAQHLQTKKYSKTKNYNIK